MYWGKVQTEQHPQDGAMSAGRMEQFASVLKMSRIQTVEDTGRSMGQEMAKELLKPNP